MEFKPENICGFLIRSRLMTPDEVKAMYQRWQAENKDPAAPLPAFMKWLVARGYVTEYQANLLAKGHADDFFLDDYKIMERVGRGRMAGVYKAVHPLGQVVAVKVLPPSRAKNHTLLARFRREARLSLRLKHPNIVRSFQIGQSQRLSYLVMEYLEGETLDEVLARRKRLPPEEAVRVIHQALLGLQHIYEQGMVHRDLKPANLMLVADGKPGELAQHGMLKILDIGLAREMYDEDSPIKSENETALTGEGVLLGTPDYLAPEQARDPRTIDIRADIYSLGCVLYHLLAGQPPFPDRNILNQLVRHATEEPKPLRSFNPQVPEGLEQIVRWMMGKQPDKRYPNPQRAAQAMEVFLLARNEPVPEVAPQMRRYLTWLETEAVPSEAGSGSEDAPAAPPAAPLPPPVDLRATPLPPSRAAAEKKAKPVAPVAIAALPAAPILAAHVAPPAPAPAAPVAPPAPPPAAAPLPALFARLPAPLNKLGERDLILLGVGAGVVLVSCTVLTVVVALARWIFS